MNVPEYAGDDQSYIRSPAKRAHASKLIVVAVR